MIRILGVDPGGVTGLCRLEIDAEVGDGGSVVDRVHKCEMRQIGGPEWDHVDLIMEMGVDVVGGYAVDYFAVESFVLRVGLNRGAASRTETLSPIRVTAMLEYALWSRQEDIPVILQSPGDAKSVVTDERLKEWGLYVGPKERLRHQRDAQRHALLCAKRLVSKKKK